MTAVCLASAPTLAEYDDLSALGDDDLHRIPLTVLALAAAVERAGLKAEVADLDALYRLFRERGGERARFALHVAERLAAQEVDVYGLSTICSSYPLTLRIAGALRRRRPKSRIILGGPQASATDVATLQAFPAVDLVVRGEADLTLPVLLRTLGEDRDLSKVPGITRRQAGGVIRNADAPPIDDLDTLPRPSYRLCASIGPRDAPPLEAGRGCPFGCSFCSTSRFFGRRFRMRSPGRIVEDMLALHRTYGSSRFELVHDNFTADRARVLAFCEALEASGARFSWSCSSRPDSLDGELLRRMRRAGCSGLFLGVESGSADVQRSIGKNLDLQRTREHLAAVGRRHVSSSVAFMAGFPGESERDLRSTVEIFLETLRFDSLEPQMSLLAPLPGTPLAIRHRRELILDQDLSDLVSRGEPLLRADRELITRHPEVFQSFYAIPLRGLDRREVHELCRFLSSAGAKVRLLLLLAARAAGGGLELFRAFHAWRSPGRGPASNIGGYYRGEVFPNDLVRFVRVRLAARAGVAGTAMAAVAQLQEDMLAAMPPPGREERPGVARRRVAPALAPGVVLSRLACDGPALLRCAFRGGDPSRLSRCASVLVLRVRRRRLEVLRPSAPAADLLGLCDGHRDEKHIAAAFARLHPEVAGVAGALAGAVGLRLLARRGLLKWDPAGR